MAGGGGSTGGNPILAVLGSIAFLVFGTLTVVCKDWQVKAFGFYVPYLWTMMTFLGQSFFFPVYLCSSSSEDGNSAKPPAPLHAYAVVTGFAFVSYIFINMSYNGLPGSILQMMKSMKLVFTCILSYFVLGQGLRKHQILGVSMNVVGILFVGYVALRGTGWSPNGSLAYWGMATTTLSCIVGAFQFVWEAKIMKQYSAPPEKLTAMEGVFGMIFGIVTIVITQALHMENATAAFEEMWSRPMVLLAFSLFLVPCVFSNYSALVVTNNANVVFRSLLDIGRTFTIWLVEIECGWVKFSWCELFGFLTMVFGTLIYNKLLVLPYWSYEEEEPLLPIKAMLKQKDGKS